MEYSLRHAMRGRVRLNVPDLGRNRRLAERLLDWLRAQSGVRSARINYDCASLVLEYDPAHESMLLAVLERFKALSLSEVKAFCTQALKDAPPAKPPEVAKDSPMALPTLSLFMAFSANPVVTAVNLPLMLYNALPIARRAWKVWDTERRLNIDVLDTLAITSSVMQGNPLAGCIITWLIKLGDWIRDLTAAGSKRAISELLEFQSRTAWVLLGDAVVSVSAAELQAGDLVVVYPGEMIPVDGEIVDGHATIDQKTITGEGLPVSRGKGEAAFAATVIREGQITVRALRVGAATTAGQIVRLVESAPTGDTRMQNHAERFADRLVTPTLALAASTAAVTGDFNRFLSLVIVDYGTGIRVAAPTAVLSSMTHAARAGIIIKSGGHMEKLAEIDTIVFDKTGTLTHGHPAVLDIIPYQGHITPNHL
ncbi:MAG: HAD-IC family P-type ATPase, partial [Bradyrhizobium sp.]